MLQTFRKNGQVPLEYVAILVIVVAALLTMQNYFKRGVQGRWKTSSDGVGDQYDPMFTTGRIEHRLAGQTITNIVTQNMAGQIQTLRADNATLTETKDGFSRVDAE